jgi:DNA/RNA-binding protein KIN17
LAFGDRQFRMTYESRVRFFRRHLWYRSFSLFSVATTICNVTFLPTDKRMPKAEKGSLKDIGKRIKAKGLQKLKFYCQMCQKQCRDANGFKCHLTSDSHLQQMKIFSSHAKSFMDQYSREFEKIFIDTLRMRHTTCKVAANVVYQEVIHDRSHIHMNSTIWATLTDFVKYLGKTGQCVVEETERGWYISYIERNTSKLLEAELTQRRLEAEQAAEVFAQERIEQQRIAAAMALERAQSAAGAGVHHSEPTKLERDATTDSANVIHMALNTKKPSLKQKAIPTGKSAFDEDNDDDDKGPQQSVSAVCHPQNVDLVNDNLPNKDRNRHDALKQPTQPERRPTSEKSTAQETNMDHKDVDTPWLYPNIVVRIINETLGDGRYFRRKGVVVKVVNQFTAQVRVQKDDDDHIQHDLLQLDQEDLETVVPKRVNEIVCIVRGKYRGAYGTVLELDKNKFHARIELQLTNQDDGRVTTKVLSRVDYDDFSKVNDSSIK